MELLAVVVSEQDVEVVLHLLDRFIQRLASACAEVVVEQTADQALIRKVRASTNPATATKRKEATQQVAFMRSGPREMGSQTAISSWSLASLCHGVTRLRSAP